MNFNKSSNFKEIDDKVLQTVLNFAVDSAEVEEDNQEELFFDFLYKSYQILDKDNLVFICKDYELYKLNLFVDKSIAIKRYNDNSDRLTVASNFKTSLEELTKLL